MVGGIRREQLYGAEGDGTDAGGAAVTSALDAQQATFRVPRTVQPAAPFQPPFLALSLELDNVTGRWWRVAGRWIPPWTVRAVVPVVPPSDQIEVERITPAGQLSEAIGDELVIVATTAALPPHAGLFVARGASGFSLQHNRRAWDVSTAGGPPVAQTVKGPPATAGNFWAVARFRARIDWETANRQAPVSVHLGYLNAVPSFFSLIGATVSWAAPEAAELTFDPPRRWPKVGEAGVSDAGLIALGEQWGYASPTRVEIEVAYFEGED